MPVGEIKPGKGEIEVEAGGERYRCRHLIITAGFPRKLAELRIRVNWDYRGTGEDIMLSSDQPGDPAGRTLHADFWNTWVQTGGTFGGMVGMVQKCVNTTTGPKTMCG